MQSPSRIDDVSNEGLTSEMMISVPRSADEVGVTLNEGETFELPLSVSLATTARDNRSRNRSRGREQKFYSKSQGASRSESPEPSRKQSGLALEHGPSNS